MYEHQVLKIWIIMWIELQFSGKTEHWRQRRHDFGLLRRRMEVPSGVQRDCQDLRLLRAVDVRRRHRQDPLHRHFKVHRLVDRHWILGHSSNGKQLLKVFQWKSKNIFFRLDVLKYRSNNMITIEFEGTTYILNLNVEIFFQKGWIFRNNYLDLEATKNWWFENNNKIKCCDLMK